MFDLHYDLLTQVYINKENPEYLKKYFKSIYNKRNIVGGIFNLFYMSPEEMREELNITLDEINIIRNLELVNDLINKYKLIPEKTEYIIGIEGLDYLEKIKDIDILYELGVRSVNIVWNNDNKFGGGARGDEKHGLTELGKELTRKLIEKNIAIDLSHANAKTFYDITKECKKMKINGYSPIVFASHSNSKKICNVPRNLTNNQIREIVDLGGVIGLVSIKQFCTNDPRVNNYASIYLKHIRYIQSLLKGTENICVSTDNMEYYKIEKEKYQTMNVFKQQCVKSEIEKELILNGYKEKEIKNMLYNNFKSKILQRL